MKWRLEKLKINAIDEKDDATGIADQRKYQNEANIATKNQIKPL